MLRTTCLRRVSRGARRRGGGGGGGGAGRGGGGGDRPGPGPRPLVGDGLRGLGRHGDDGDLDATRLELARQIPAGQDRHAPDVAADLGRILVEDRGDPEALAREPLVVEERGAEVAEAHQRHRPLAIEPEDLLELGLEAGDVVTDAAHAELAEVREVLPDLRGVEVEALGELLRGDGLHAVLFELLQTARVHRETADRHLRDLRQSVALTPRHDAGAAWAAPVPPWSPT